MADQPPGEFLIIEPNTLVFYVDESGDEQLSNQQHPIFAFGGVACPFDFHLPIARAWQAMKAEHFPQVDGPLHAKNHLQDRLRETKRLAVLAGTAHEQLGRFRNGNHEQHRRAAGLDLHGCVHGVSKEVC